MKRLMIVAAGLLAFLTLQAAEVPAVSGQSRFAKRGTNKVHNITTGHGAVPIVLIHGWTGEADWWRYQVPARSERSKLLLIDLPGHGRSDKPVVSYTMELCARAVDAVLRDAGIDKAILAGFRMGVPVMS